MKILIPILLTAVAALSAALWSSPQPAAPTLSPIMIQASDPPEYQAQAFMLPAVHPAYAPIRNTSLEEPSPDANAAVVYHSATDTTLFAKNEAVRAPIASLTKILTAMVVDSLLGPDEIVTVASSSVRVDGEKQTLYIDEQITVGDLMTMLLVESSNDAAYALADHALTKDIDLMVEMNIRARSLGMLDSHFTDPSGLDDAAYSTVRDLVRLVRAAQETPHLWTVMKEPEATVYSIDGEIEHISINTNQLLGDVPGILWGKTGNTDGALGCMIMVVEMPDRDDTLISIILGSRARFADTSALLSWATQAWQWR